MEAAIVAAPDAAPVVRGNGRHPQVALGWLRTGQAGRHSRDLLLVRRPRSRLLLTAYAKADRDDLTAADKKALARLVAEIEQERQSE